MSFKNLLYYKYQNLNAVSAGYLSLVCALDFAEKFNETLLGVADEYRSER